MPSSRRIAMLAAGFVVAATSVVTLSTTGLAVTPPTAFGYGAPGFVNSAATSNFFGNTVSGEPSIGIDWKTGAAMYMGGTSTAKITFDNSTTPTTVTWSDVSSIYSEANLDPILATDHESGRTIAGGDDGACAAMSITTNDGGGGFGDPTAWTPSAPCPFAADHPTVGFGPFHGTPPVGASGNLATYFCQQGDVVDECSHSADGGLTWSPSVPDSNLDCVSLFGHVKVSADGTAYIPNANCFDAQSNPVVGGLMTTDNGQTLTGYAIPNAPTPARGFDPSVATTPDNTVYESWSRDGDYHPVVTWSHDHGATWAPQVDLANTVTPALSAATFQAAVAGDNGRAAVAYLGTWANTSGVTPFDSGYHGVWYLFVSSTTDGGQTWHTVQATPEPVQRGSISDGGTTSTGQRNLLDFIDASVTKDGRIVVAYADGCLDTCNGASGTEAQSTNQYATVAYQSTGQGLFSAYDVSPVTAPAAPVLTATPGSSHVDLSWTTPDNGGSPITGYQVLRGTAPGAETPYATTSATSYTDNSVTPGTTYYYQVTATNAVGTGPPSAEVTATPTTTPAAPVLNAAGGNNQVNVSWSAPGDGGKPITGYEVYRGTVTGTETPYAAVSSATSYVDTQVTPKTTYYYRVAAVNANGTGASSNESSATATTVPSPPTLTATAGKGQVSLAWTAPADGGAPISGFGIYRTTTSGAETLIQTISSGTSYIDTTGTAGTTYFYEVAAINRNGTGTNSNEVTASPRKGR